MFGPVKTTMRESVPSSVSFGTKSSPPVASTTGWRPSLISNPPRRQPDRPATPAPISWWPFTSKKNPYENPPEERVIDAFTERLQVYQVPGSRVIGITFTSKDPKLAATIPNAMAAVYLATQSGAKLDSNSEATRWLEPEIENLRQKVNDAEQKVAEYRAEHGLLPTNGGANFPTQQLNDISAELTRVRGERQCRGARAVRAHLSAGRATRYAAGHHVVSVDPAAEEHGIRPAVADLRSADLACSTTIPG